MVGSATVAQRLVEKSRTAGTQADLGFLQFIQHPSWLFRTNRLYWQ